VNSRAFLYLFRSVSAWFSRWYKPVLLYLVLWILTMAFGSVYQHFMGRLYGLEEEDKNFITRLQLQISTLVGLAFIVFYKYFRRQLDNYWGSISLGLLGLGIAALATYHSLNAAWVEDLSGTWQLVGLTKFAKAYRKSVKPGATTQQMLDDFPDHSDWIISKEDHRNRRFCLGLVFSLNAPLFALTLIGLVQSDFIRRIGRKTVVELDLIGYSTIAAELEEGFGVGAIPELNAKIQGFIDLGLSAVRAKRRTNVVQTAGDNALLVFSRPLDAHTFAQAVHEATRKYNSALVEPLDKRVFRIGAGSGDVVMQNLPGGGVDIVGITIARAVRLEAKAKPGGLLIDRATFLGLPRELKTKYGPPEEIPGKRDEIFEAYRCSMYPEAPREIAPLADRAAAKRKGDAPLDSPVPELLATLPSIDLKRLIYLLNLPVTERPSATSSDEEHQRVILAWAGQEQGRLEALKDEIIDLMSSGTAFAFKNSASSLSRPRECKILFLAANPPDGIRLSLDEESREIKQKILGSRYRDKIKFDTEWAIRPDDALRLLNEFEPDVVHFSGHGNESGAIIMVDEAGRSTIVTGTALKEVFSSITKKPRLVLLNACFSQAEANEIKNVVGCTIGMNRAIGDKAAIKFAGAFYQAIGYGKSVQEAFDQGKAALTINNIPEEMTPVLLCQDGIDPDTIVLA
jgi:class 3 adenylate cyclase